MIELSERNFAEGSLEVFENERVLFGYSTLGFTASALKSFMTGRPLLFLKQVHSDRIVTQQEWRPGIEADGLILDQPGAVAVIQTADCLPLFFFHDGSRRGGVIHVGWRGLQKGIEEKLIALLADDLKKYNFYLGPAIEKDCYEVGEEFPVLFRGKNYAAGIFEARGSGKFSMDLKSGLILSLRAAGVAAERIGVSGACTYCRQGRFPSYRRDGKTGKRIYNFLMLKNNAAAGA